jgi:hypothetical protein
MVCAPWEAILDAPAAGLSDRLDHPLYPDGPQSLADLGPRSAVRRSHQGGDWFLVQLALNALWSPVFFGLHSTSAALVVIIALLAAIAATMIAAARVDRLAAWLLAPYLLWVAYATTINIGVVQMNQAV